MIPMTTMIPESRDQEPNLNIDTLHTGPTLTNSTDLLSMLSSPSRTAGTGTLSEAGFHDVEGSTLSFNDTQAYGQGRGGEQRQDQGYQSQEGQIQGRNQHFDLRAPSSTVSFDKLVHVSTVYTAMSDKDGDKELGDHPMMDIRHVGSGETVTSVMTADGVVDPISFKINCFAIFVGDMARGIFFPTMWNLVQVLGGDQVLLGYVTSSFSFGRMLVLPLFGKLSTVDGIGCRKVLLGASIIFFVGTIMFTQILNVGKPWFLLLSNVVLGIGSGTLAVTRAYTSDVTPTRSRTGYMALISAIQYGGTTCTPFLGSLFVVMFANEDEGVDRGVFAVNEYTAPAIFMALATATLFYLLYIYFEDAQKTHQNDGKKKLSARRQACQDLHDEPVCCGQLTKHTLCLIACMFLNVFVKGPMSCFETLGVEFANSTFNMPREDAGMIVAFAGFLGAMNLLILRISITQYYTDIQIIMFGYSMFIVGILTNLFLDMEDSDNNSKWMYALSIFFIYSVGYPVCHVALIGFFSKVIGRRPQGTMMGLFAASGSFSRVFFPVFSGYIVAYKDIGTLFYFLAVVLSISLLTVFCFRRTLTMLSQ